MIEKGIDVNPLLNSDIFHYEFDFDSWPSTHYNQSEELRPYNENLFQLREFYEKVFPEEEFRSIDDERPKSVFKGCFSFFKKEEHKHKKVFKIKYSINMLPIIGVYVDKEIDIYTKKVTMTLAN